MRTVRAWVALAIPLSLGCILPVPSQSQSRSPDAVGQALRNEQMGILPDTQVLDPLMAERRVRALNLERQKRMVADANKLLALAKELNNEVAAMNAGSFTADQLRKITEIEKLARSVRERMTADVTEFPSASPQQRPVFPVHP